MTVLRRPLLPGQHPGQVVGRQRQRVRPQRGDAGHLSGIINEPHRQPFLGAGLGQVESEALVGLARVVQVHPQRDRALAGFQRRRGQFVRPAQPARPRQMGDQVQIAGLQAEVLAPAVGAGHRLPVQHRDRRIEGLQHRERRNVDAADREADRMATQVVSQGLDLREFGHGFQSAAAPTTAPSSRSTRRSRPRSRSTRSRRSAVPNGWCVR